MNQSTSLYLSALREVKWQSVDSFRFPNSLTERWVLENGSMSHLIKSNCQNLTVKVLHNKVVKAERLNHQEIQLLDYQQCLLRKVALCGDDVPWVLGRTLIPESSLDLKGHDFSKQGDTPLGVTIFGSEDVQRDSLQVGVVSTETGDVFARRSRLWVNQKPMLVAELFLPECPMYSGETDK
ncbi:chorismate lyase [Vibrio sp. S4M6]|uniref:chorismate lyase n=1 Tax=Vibrio sinus TaxID=2946865 RepID=UPI00202A5044|nr:chorismate lyase [Vibrio sinus]MCL9783572.1 chorismate lyase [Vibrio sinus]